MIFQGLKLETSGGAEVGIGVTRCGRENVALTGGAMGWVTLRLTIVSSSTSSTPSTSGGAAVSVR